MSSQGVSVPGSEELIAKNIIQNDLDLQNKVITVHEFTERNIALWTSALRHPNSRRILDLVKAGENN